VAKPDDVKGLKIRTMDSPMAKAALATWGPHDAHGGRGALYGLAARSVEGRRTLNTIYSHKFYEVQSTWR